MSRGHGNGDITRRMSMGKFGQDMFSCILPKIPSLRNGENYIKQEQLKHGAGFVGCPPNPVKAEATLFSEMLDVQHHSPGIPWRNQVRDD
ncbi:hypothetical protein RHMOL_Rhmol02G0122600 [Rhododendron molle]|uniref:Uncharacterized protein n=1 Tax=Rhododendron molle TaxID=49168 RepID=A0ACC0PNY6_RHOML|nr:hypothetical protein RHMOL_Rhmol02G0122600 [Rhododendron molle]